MEGAPLARSLSQSVYDRGVTDCASQRRFRGTVPPIDGITISYLPSFGTRPFSSAYPAVRSVQPLFLTSLELAWRLYTGVLADDVDSGSTHGGLCPRVHRRLLAARETFLIARMEAFPKEMGTAIRRSARQQGPPSWHLRLKLPHTCAPSILQPAFPRRRHSRDQSYDTRRRAESPAIPRWG